MQVSFIFWLLLPSIAAVIAAALVIVIRPLLWRYTLARPNARSSHKIPTPQGGGIPVIVTTIAAAVTVQFLAAPASSPTPMLAVFAASVFLGAVGTVDDIRAIPILPRLTLQALAIVAVIAALPSDLRILPALPWWVERALILLGSLWFVNLVNFMDGLDWMTVAEVVPVTFGLAILGTIGALPEHAMITALALLGAMIGFAPFNKPVARLFLGDVGSLPIGLLLSWLLILVAGSGNLVAAILLPLYYISDATITLGRRILHLQPVWEGHREHFYQRAFDNGLPAIAIVRRVFIVNVVLAMLAIATVTVPSTSFTAVALGFGIAIVAWLLHSLTANASSTA